MRSILFSVILACILWFLLFFPSVATPIPFWPMMTVSVSLLTLGGLYVQRKQLHRLFSFKLYSIFLGLLCALLLYGIFFIGGEIIRRLFQQSGYFIQSVYDSKQNVSPLMISLLLFFIIAPGEEIFWRGYIQDFFMRTFGPIKGYLLAVFLYTIVHIWAFNPLLIVAACICGFFWGGLYLRFRSLWPAILSHAVWDVMIFIVLPLAS